MCVCVCLSVRACARACARAYATNPHTMRYESYVHNTTNKAETNEALYPKHRRAYGVGRMSVKSSKNLVLWSHFLA